MTGTEHDVTDSHAIGKLSNSVLFEKADGDEPKKRGGRQPKPAAPEQEG
jgi:hypothetical protein